jgi:hypothetical protein
MELAETLVLAGMVRRHVVGESEEKESEGFSWDEVEAGLLGATGVRLRFEWVVKGLRDLFHLFESVYDGGVELVFVGEVVLKIATGCKCLWTEGTPVASRELTKETVEVELAECRGDISTALTVKEGKVARVHSGVVNHGK